MRPGDSTRSTSAPMSASSSEANGPGNRVEKSSTFNDDNGPFMLLLWVAGHWSGSPAEQPIHPPRGATWPWRQSFMPRLMISFMISEVPAKIRWMRALAYILQIGYSHM